MIEHLPLHAALPSCDGERRPLLVVDSLLGASGATWRHFIFHSQEYEEDASVPPVAQAIVLGEVEDSEGVLCRVHSSCSSAHDFLSTDCDCVGQMRRAQEEIVEQGQGVIILLGQDGRGFGAAALAQVKDAVDRHVYSNQNDAYIGLFGRADSRTYGSAAIVLRALGVGSITLMTENVQKSEELIQNGIAVKQTIPMRTEATDTTKYAAYGTLSVASD